jgi:uncharacterized protein
MSDDLHRPLGQGPREKPPSPNPLWRRVAIGAGAALVVAGAAMVPHDPLGWTLGGRPYAVAKIEAYAPPSEPPVQTRAPQGVGGPSQQGEAAAQSGDVRGATAGETEIQAGVKVTRSGGGAGPVIIQINPSSSGLRLTPAPDRRVAEKGRYGLLPRVGADGARPMEIYARPFVSASQLKADAPRIALVIGGLGLNAQATDAAIADTPEAVTLAFAPYGASVAADAARARARGHETMLQAPMEPFDYPQNNPGAHTLRVGGDAVEDLSWLMSRFTGYAGIMNFLGGRFTSDEKALSPALAEIARRGLYFLDDGASPQSRVGPVAMRLSLPVARVDITLDAKGTPQSLDAALTQLEAQARRTGAAIGFANAQPAVIERVARFARDAERRGIAIAPASAMLSPGGAASAAIGIGK